jgi:endonuclease/exonuclease/phosphatase (EEP) superfamily protein YafD
MSRRRRRGRRPGLLLTISTLLYGLALVAITAANLIGPERWWIGSANLYLPQWIWALPCALLLPWYLLRAWRFAWIPLAMAAWVFGPIMGWSFGPARLSPTPAGDRLRVMSYNVKWGTRGAAAIIDNVTRANPDVVLMQDSAGSVDNVLARLKKPGWYVVKLTQYTVLSRYPITDVEYKWLLGIIPEDEAIITSTNRGEPVSLTETSMSGQAFRDIARRLKGEEVPFLDLEERTGIFDRLMQLFSGKR